MIEIGKKVKKQSRKSKIHHPVWQMTRKNPKCFQEILQEAHKGISLKNTPLLS